MTAKELIKVLNELEARGVLADDWEEVFGSQSFDEVLSIVNGVAA